MMLALFEEVSKVNGLSTQNDWAMHCKNTRSWPILYYYSSMSLGRLRKSTKFCIRIAAIQAGIYP